MKIRVTTTIVHEYEPDPEDYDGAITPDDVIAVDRENYEVNGGVLFDLENPESVVTTTFEVLED